MNISKHVAAGLTLVSALVVAACSSSSDSTPAADAGADAFVPVVTGETGLNPYGVAYPSTRIGSQPRGFSKATTPGNRIDNFVFKGTMTGNPDAVQARVPMANFFDPESRTHKLIFVQAAGIWCTYCRQEAAAVAPNMQELKDLGVLWLTAIIESKNAGTPATLADLNTWYNWYEIPSPMVLDAGADKFGILFSAASMPWNAIIDARSMEILEAQQGASSYAQMKAKAIEWTEWQKKNPALPAE